MPAIDFCEIPVPTNGPRRDAFEQFARDFLLLLGFKILTEPDRGADAGRDLIVQETRTGVVGETLVNWLVSCKHKAHSGTAVSANDEQDIHDRVKTHGCAGFLAFYSTLAAQSLAAKLNAKDLEYEVKILDGEAIERELLRSSPEYLALGRRYFPKSFAK